MNGDEFDFDALRDPDAPIPGTRQRAGVNMRARQLRARSRRNRLAASATSLVAVVAIVALVVANTHDAGPAIHVAGTSTTLPTTTSSPASSVDGRFVPPTHMENGKVVLPVTFPDGETTTLRYPPAMKIAQLGFAGGVGVGNAQALISYTTIARAYRGLTPITSYPGANGDPVAYLPGVRPGAGNGPRPPNELAFQFGPWLVRIAGLDAGQRVAWAHALTGTLDANGYLVLHATAPLSIGTGFDGGFGAFVAGDNEVELASHAYCGQAGSDTAAHRRFTNGDGSHGVSWCVGALHVAASGSASFADLAYRGLEAGPLTAPTGPVSVGGTTSTTTTTLPAVSASALSASFVSSTHGWALEGNGNVAETTDGGRTWSTVGSIGSNNNSKIRFADATHGFAFTTGESNRTTPLATTDGGRTWTTMKVPYGDVYDMAASGGILYAVTFDQVNAKFRISSSPAANISWTIDPLAIAPGAGPVPHVQLVFSGGHGWLVDVDRTVVGGAQLASPGGHWTAWTPPCTTVNGPEFLAAWSATDLIATCDEGVWGSPPPPAHAVYTSHDAGATFQRHPAPAFGGVAVSGPNDAFIVNGDTVRRSVDGGRTWSVAESVTNPNATVPSDFGFTTDTQGFVIFTNGQMIMSYDAGATWSAVTLP